jgi:acyl transferase domain-containing protein
MPMWSLIQQENFNVSRSNEQKKAVAVDMPHLLVYSAKSPESLKQIIQRYQEFFENTTEVLADVAYTLANRREHFLYRSFAVATTDGLGIASPPPSSGKPSEIPALVMVFTGQGAQWPQMGRELLRSNEVFRRTIRALDHHLQSLASAPSWKIEEELLKPTRMSRVLEDELSQPLGTALQIALVDTFASVGIKPYAVVGHSGGETAAAYASGGLTAEEAIRVAFCRGDLLTLQMKSGAMAAVGLSWEETKKYLLPGVVVACENSPNSVTISGEADKWKFRWPILKIPCQGYSQPC